MAEDDRAAPLPGPASARTARPRGPPGRKGEVRQVRPESRRRAVNCAPPRRLYLYSRQHIDLLRVAGALCCS
ncbi:putative leader peptide [Streptomyces sp. NPDC091267]|uniref:putative leader peptide n=1 Tax=unclassified Streptomyces TaxID=2593676 RepID=UPI00342DCDE4